MYAEPVNMHIDAHALCGSPRSALSQASPPEQRKAQRAKLKRGQFLQGAQEDIGEVLLPPSPCLLEHPSLGELGQGLAEGGEAHNEDGRATQGSEGREASSCGVLQREVLLSSRGPGYD